MWSSNYKKSTYKLNYVGKLANTQSNQQMIHRRPTLQRFLTPISMGRAVVPRTNGAANPYGPAQDARCQVWRRNGRFACLEHQQETHKKERNIVHWPVVAAILWQHTTTN